MNPYDWKKNIFDKTFGVLLIIMLFPMIGISIILATIDTKSWGIFSQKRIGQWGKPFVIFKLKTMCPNDYKISKLGAFFRKTKLDELPQLINIIKGDMSFVGPRPDIEGYYDQLIGENRKILSLKPGLTSEASLKYSNEEYLLAMQKEPLLYNDEIIFPDKIQMNLNYLEQQSFILDIKIMLKTIRKIVS